MKAQVLNLVQQYRYLIVAILAVALLGAAGMMASQTASADSAHDQSEAIADSAPQNIPVGVVESQPVRIWNSFSGRITAVDSAEIRPQISGRITEIKFTDGQQVQAGDVLIVIDPRPFEAAVKQARADLSAAKSQRELAQLEFDRAESLRAADAIAQSVLDTRRNRLDAARSAVLAAEAMLIQAEVNLDYANIKAPITGQMSRAELTVGNLVQAGLNAPLLTSIVATDRVYAEFEIDETTYLNNVHNVTRQSDSDSRVPVKVRVGNNNLEFEGSVHSFDNQLNPTTGTIRARAILTNPHGTLLPGMFAQVQMANPDEQTELVVPQSAIGIDQDRRFVYVVTEENIAEYREVTLGREVQNHRVITAGLTAGERVITDRINMVRSGQTITPQQVAIRLEYERTQLAKDANGHSKTSI